MCLLGRDQLNLCKLHSKSAPCCTKTNVRFRPKADIQEKGSGLSIIIGDVAHCLYLSYDEEYTITHDESG